MGEILKMCCSGWLTYAQERKVPAHPRDWDENHVKTWLQWSIDEFQLGGMTMEELEAAFDVRFRTHVQFLTVSDSF